MLERGPAKKYLIGYITAEISFFILTFILLIKSVSRIGILAFERLGRGGLEEPSTFVFENVHGFAREGDCRRRKGLEGETPAIIGGGDL